MVKTLLQRKNNNPNISEIKYRRMPFLWTVENGDEGVTRLLLEREGRNETCLYKALIGYAG